MSSTGQIVGGVVGAVVGFFAGGNVVIGAQIGMMIGGLIDPPKVMGPRLDDLSAQTSTYGAFVPRIYGTAPVVGNIFWIQGNKLIEREAESSGKGGPEVTNFEYFATFAVGLCEGPIDGVRRIWIGGQLWYDAGSSDLSTIIASNENPGTFTLHNGSDTQLADPLIQADHGVANVPAYRGLAYIVFNELPVKDYGNSLAGAQVKVEVVGSGAIAPALIDDYTFSNENPSFTFDGVSANHVISGLSYDLNGFSHYIARDASGLGYPMQVRKAPGVTVSERISDEDYKLLSASSLFPISQAFYATQNSLTSMEYAFAVKADGDNVHLVWGASQSVDGCYVSLSFGTSVKSFAQSGASIYFIYGNNLAYVTGYSGVGRLKAYASLYVGTNSAGAFTSYGGFAYLILRELSTGQVTITQYLENTLVDTFYVTPAATGSIGYAGSAAYSENGKIYVMRPLDGNCALIIIDVATKAIEAEYALPSPTLGAVSPAGANLIIDGELVHLSNWRSNVTPQSERHRVWVLNRMSGTTIPLSSIVQSECLKSDLLAAADLDITDLTDQVRGYRVSSLAPLRGGIDPLRKAWPFDVIQHGYKIKFKRRGGASVATITEGELDARTAGSDPGVQITNVREMDLVLPNQLTAKYLDAAREYDVNVAEESRQ